MTTNNNQTPFEKIKKINEFGEEYWSARDLFKLLEYSEYRHFIPVIEKAKEACKNSGYNIEDHFEEVLDMVEMGSKSKRQLESYNLSRYACYLIIQNADPNKEIVALGQTLSAKLSWSYKRLLCFLKSQIDLCSKNYYNINTSLSAMATVHGLSSSSVMSCYLLV